MEKCWRLKLLDHNLITSIVVLIVTCNSYAQEIFMGFECIQETFTTSVLNTDPNSLPADVTVFEHCGDNWTYLVTEPDNGINGLFQSCNQLVDFNCGSNSISNQGYLFLDSFSFPVENDRSIYPGIFRFKFGFLIYNEVIDRYFNIYFKSSDNGCEDYLINLQSDIVFNSQVELLTTFTNSCQEPQSYLPLYGFTPHYDLSYVGNSFFVNNGKIELTCDGLIRYWVNNQLVFEEEYWSDYLPFKFSIGNGEWSSGVQELFDDRFFIGEIYYTPSETETFIEEIFIEKTSGFYLQNEQAFQNGNGIFEETIKDYKHCLDTIKHYFTHSFKECLNNQITAFSPNQDGINDTYSFYEHVADLDFCVVDYQTLSVYDRWGELVFDTKEEESVVWDGRDRNGNELDLGSYLALWEIKFEGNNEVIPYTTSVSVIK